jgi:hypothetical protein
MATTLPPPPPLPRLALFPRTRHIISLRSASPRRPVIDLLPVGIPTVVLSRCRCACQRYRFVDSVAGRHGAGAGAGERWGVPALLLRRPPPRLLLEQDGGGELEPTTHQFLTNDTVHAKRARGFLFFDLNSIRLLVSWTKECPQH